MFTPRIDENEFPVTLAPTRNRERPRVWERSPKMGPVEPDVAIGTPVGSRRKVVPLLVAPMGILETVVRKALVRKLTMVSATACSSGLKWLAWFPADVDRQMRSPHPDPN
jgi:hypothetical protein